jgi:hypothetical protein
MKLVAGFIAIASVTFTVCTQARQEPVETERCEVYAKQTVPKFHLAKKYRTHPKPGLVLFVSIAPSDVHQEKLLALVCKLGRDHAVEEALWVFVLDSYRAAKRFNPQGEGNDRQTALSYRAGYWFWRETGKDAHSLDWWPDPYDRSRSIHIDLGNPPRRPGS